MHTSPSSHELAGALRSILGRARLLRLMVTLLLLAAALEFSIPAKAGQLAPASAAQIIVNSAADNVTADASLTLREAILAANGAVVSGWTPGEQAQMPGCSFDGSGAIIAGCGAGAHELILFSASLGGAPTIALSSSLPVIDDNSSLEIDGDTTYPIIDGGAIGADSDILIITSDANVLNNLSLVNSRRHAVRIEGDSNTLTGIIANSNLASGIAIVGGRFNMLDGIVSGASSPIAAVCAANGTYGVLMGTNAVSNTIRNSTLVCNPIAGVALSAADAVSNTVGPGNYIGINAGGTALANAIGVVVEGAASGNSVHSNTIRSNTGIGIIVRIDATGNDIAENVIRGNGTHGIALESGANNNTVSANTLAENASHGIYVDGSTTFSNSASDNLIGVIRAPGYTLAGNGQSGVFVTGGAHHNSFAGNTIAANSSHGIVVTGAYSNTFRSENIGRTPAPSLHARTVRSSALASFGNGGVGVRISGGSSGNLIESTDISENAQGGIVITGASNANVISATTVYSHTAPGVDGVVISGASNSNLIFFSGIGASAGVGLLIDGSAFNRVRNSVVGPLDLGGGRSAGNGLDGIRLTNGAQYNIIGGEQGASNFIDRNGGAGVLISGGSTNNVNCIGGNIFGMLSGPNGSTLSPAAAIHVDNAGSGNVIGHSPSCGATALIGNQIVSATAASIMINGAASTDAVVAGNMIISSTGAGIHLMGGVTHATIGSPGYENMVMRGSADGIRIHGGGNNVVHANRVGFNALDGIAILDSSNNVIGSNGVATDTGNLLAFNGKSGVVVFGATSVGNRISRNTIYANGKLSIDLGDGTEDGFGVTENDVGDADGGPNTLLNYPNALTTTLVNGVLSGSVPAAGTVEVYVLDASADPSGHGEAYRWIGDAPANGGRFSFAITPNASGRCVTTLFIDASNNTSELSANICLPKRVMLPLMRR